jgi:hypothetical protein
MCKSMVDVVQKVPFLGIFLSTFKIDYILTASGSYLVVLPLKEFRLSKYIELKLNLHGGYYCSLKKN